ncbi:hypothetical protein L204_105361 [Cryptococcus depauperatus]
MLYYYRDTDATAAITRYPFVSTCILEPIFASNACLDIPNFRRPTILGWKLQHQIKKNNGVHNREQGLLESRQPASTRSNPALPPSLIAVLLFIIFMADYDVQDEELGICFFIRIAVRKMMFSTFIVQGTVTIKAFSRGLWLSLTL